MAERFKPIPHAAEPALSYVDDATGVHLYVDKPGSYPDGYYPFPNGLTISQFHFVPNSYNTPHTEDAPFILISLVDGLTELMTHIDSGAVLRPDVLYGVTNEPMARAIRRFGFRTTKFPADKERTIIIEDLGHAIKGPIYETVGTPASVKAALGRLRSRRTYSGRNAIDILRDKISPAVVFETNKSA